MPFVFHPMRSAIRVASDMRAIRERIGGGFAVRIPSAPPIIVCYELENTAFPLIKLLK
jgi:hypothetical protein